MSSVATPIYSSLADDPDLAEIVEMFVDEMPGRASAVQSAWSTGNKEELGRLAHQLKGAAGSYGFDEVTPYAASLEKAVRGGAEDEIVKKCLDDLLAVCGRISSGTA